MSRDAGRGRRLANDNLALGFWAAGITLLVNALFASPLHLPGSLALTAILLGAAESPLATFRPIPRPAPVTIATLPAKRRFCCAEV